MTWVLDASAVLCWLKLEIGAENVEHVLLGDEPAIIHAVNMVEVQYYLLRLRRGEQALREAVERIDAAGVEVVRDMDDMLLSTASQLKAHQTPIALGDVFAVALAAQRGGTLLTTDRGELDKLVTLGICPIEFVR